MTEYDELKAFLAERDALFRNPTPEAALTFWNHQGFPAPYSEDVPLATVHKARLQWLGATDAMLAESSLWLHEHHYKTTLRGGDPLTPQTRDEQRVMHGKPPLGSAQ